MFWFMIVLNKENEIPLLSINKIFQNNSFSIIIISLIQLTYLLIIHSINILGHYQNNLMKKENKKRRSKMKLKEGENMFRSLDLENEEQKNKQKQEINVEEVKVINLKSDSPLTIPLDEMYSLIATKPGLCYKFEGILEIAFASGEFRINGVLNDFNPAQKNGLLELAQTHEESTANVYSMVKSLGLNVGLIEPYNEILQSCAPMIVHCRDLVMEETHPPWSDKIFELLDSAVEAKEISILIAGNKNSGKSTLSEFALNYLYGCGREVCLLDLDLGKGRGLPGTVNLYIHSKDAEEETITYWVGEYTPLNYHKLYIESVKKLVAIFKSRYFNHALLVNTMGYLTGFGEIVMKEIYDIIDPATIVFLSKEKDRSQFQSTRNYLTADQTISGYEQKQRQKRFQFHPNPHANIKPDIVTKSKRFEDYLQFDSVKSFSSKPPKELIFHDLYIQTQDGQVIKKLFNPYYTDLSLLILCDHDGYLFKFKGLGYGFGGKLFGKEGSQICIKSEVGEFQKQFYDIGEKQLIALQETLECQVPFLLPSYSGLGIMGYRNLTSKNIRL